MIRDPFEIFTPFKDKFDTCIFRKEDENPFHENHAQDAFDADGCAGLHQVHGDKTVIVYDSQRRQEEADGMISNVTNLVLSTRWADCQNFVVYAPNHHVAGVIHAGWKGLVKGVIPAFFQRLEQAYSIDTSDLLVGAGPCLCLNCSEFSNPEEELPEIDTTFIHGRNVDLRAVANQQLQNAGILNSNIERMNTCTKCESDLYWTYRGGDRDMVKEAHVNALCCRLK